MLYPPILMYHAIGAPPPGAWHYKAVATCVPADELSRQAAALRAWGYRGLTLRAALDGIANGDRRVVLTFDDGYSSFFEQALPVLGDAGFSATVFVVAGAVGRTAPWSLPLPLMDARQLRALSDAGIEIGSHGLSQRSLATLAGAEQRRGVTESKARLEDLLGVPVTSFAYPYGHRFAGDEDLLASAGYRAACATRRDNRSGPGDQYALPRIMISPGRGCWRLRYYLSPLYHLECRWKRWWRESA